MLKNKILLVDRIIIHYEPQKKDSTIQAIPVETDKQTLSDHFGEAPYFYLARVSNAGNAVLEAKLFPNPYMHEEKGKGIKVSEWLVGKGVDVVYTRKGFDGKGPAYVFSSADVEVIVTGARTLAELQKSIPAFSRLAEGG